MQIVIDIPKYVYDTIVASDGYIADCDNEKVGMAVKNGTLLPEYYTLKDVWHLMRGLYEEICVGEETYATKEVYEMIENEAPTIFEAPKEMENVDSN